MARNGISGEQVGNYGPTVRGSSTPPRVNSAPKPKKGRGDARAATLESMAKSVVNYRTKT